MSLRQPLAAQPVAVAEHGRESGSVGADPTVEMVMLLVFGLAGPVAGANEGDYLVIDSGDADVRSIELFEDDHTIEGVARLLCRDAGLARFADVVARADPAARQVWNVAIALAAERLFRRGGHWGLRSP